MSDTETAQAAAKPSTPRKRGRPKKEPTPTRKKEPTDTSPNVTPKAKRAGPGRPRKTKIIKVEKRPRGRPKSGNLTVEREHPPVAEMVMAAADDLCNLDRKGCSLSAIKKYITANYRVDMEKQAIFVRRYVRRAVEEGKLTQTKGSGAGGSFKLPVNKTGKPATKDTPKSKAKRGRGRPKGVKNKPKRKSPVKAKSKARSKSKGKRKQKE